MGKAAKVVKIPVAWRRDVCDILDNHVDRVDMSQRVSDDWLSRTDCNDGVVFVYQLCAVLSEALRDDEIKGTKIDSVGNDYGEIWEFKFGQNEYGKISLRLTRKKNGTKRVYIYSAHIAERPYL